MQGWHCHTLPNLSTNCIKVYSLFCVIEHVRIAKVVAHSKKEEKKHNDTEQFACL